MFVRSANPIWYEFNQTGQLFDDTYWAFFLENTAPYSFQAVYQDENGMTPWANPLQFLSNGGLPNNLYFNPDEVYRIQFRQGPTSADPLIYEIDNYVPGDGGVSPVVDSLLVSENLITNPQFADILFVSPLVITAAGTYNIAQGWNLVLTGSGSCTVTQHAYSGTGVPANIGNPPYAIEIATSGGWATVQLIQTFTNNGALFAGGSIAFYMLAFVDGANEAITIDYVPTSPGTTQTILSTTVLAGVFAPYSNVIDVLASTNTSVPPAASVSIVINLLTTGDITISNVQVTGQSTPFVGTGAPIFQELTYQQVVNAEFNVYRNPLVYKPIESFLVGWDFPLNPAQFFGSPSITAKSFGANGAGYIWDQTIIFQAVDLTLSYMRDTATGGFLIFDNTTATRFAVIQYLSGTQLFSMLNQRMSIELKGRIHTGTITGTVSLYWTASASVETLPASIVTAVSAGGIPTIDSAGITWNVVPNTSALNSNNLVSFTLTTTNTVFDFNMFDATAVDTSTAKNFAIVIAFDTLAPTNHVTLDYVSLCGGDIATRPAAKTPDETLRECQYYYESSYDLGVAPGASPVGGGLLFQQLGANSGGNVVFVARAFGFQFNTRKIADPVITIYSPLTGSSATVDGFLRGNGSPVVSSGPVAFSNWVAASGITTVSADYAAANDTELLTHAPNVTYPEGYIILNYTADSRIGM